MLVQLCQQASPSRAERSTQSSAEQGAVRPSSARHRRAPPSSSAHDSLLVDRTPPPSLSLLCGRATSGRPVSSPLPPKSCTSRPRPSALLSSSESFHPAPSPCTSCQSLLPLALSARCNVCAVIHTFSVTEELESSIIRCCFVVDSSRRFSFKMRPCSCWSSATSIPSSSDISTTCHTQEPSIAF
jgi:hypothetical protein